MPPTEAELLAKMRVLEERIKAPSIWGRVACGIRFEDLQEKRYEDAVRLLKKHFLPEEVTYRSVKIADDKEGTDEFTHNLRIWMKDKMSIAAVKEGTEKLVGCLIMRIQEKHAFSRTFSRVKVTYNPLYSTVMTFYNEVEKPVNLFDKLGVRRYFKVYILALKSRYRHRGIGKELLKASFPLARSANVPAVCSIFTTGHMQRIAEEVGFEKFNEIYYIRYLIDEEIVFWDTGKGNYGAALMGCRISGVEDPQEQQLKPQRSSRFSIQPLDDEDGKLSNKEQLIYKRSWLVKEMLQAAIASSINADVPAIVGLFTTGRQQQIAEDLGFIKYNEIFYDKYKVNNELIFESGVSNYSTALMGYRIPEVELPLETESSNTRHNVHIIGEEEIISPPSECDICWENGCG